MRKWVSDRLKRRKKKTEEQPTEPSQAPLQPAYFEGEPQAPQASEHHAPEAPPQPERETAEPAQTHQDDNAPVMARRSPNQNSANTDQRARNRRRRGGRNRGRNSNRNARPQIASQSAGPVPVAGGDSNAATPASQPSKGVVILAIGLPGSGKSSWFKRHNITPLSSDMLRALLFDDPTEQRFQDLIFSNLRSMLKARLVAHRPLNYVDTTNLTPHDRHSWIKLAKDFGFEAQAVFFDVPLDVCLERNQKRDRVVPEEIMRRFAEKLKPPTFEEGFSKITVVRVKQKEAQVS